jgi:hypothetical protein
MPAKLGVSHAGIAFLGTVPGTTGSNVFDTSDCFTVFNTSDSVMSVPGHALDTQRIIVQRIGEYA